MVRSPCRAATATFALKVGVWFRRGRLFMVSPDSLATACPLSGRNSTYRPVQISETTSHPPFVSDGASTVVCIDARYGTMTLHSHLAPQSHRHPPGEQQLLYPQWLRALVDGRRNRSAAGRRRERGRCH